MAQKKIELTAGGQPVSLYLSDAARHPAENPPARRVVFVNEFEGDGGGIFDALAASDKGFPPYALAVISGIDWDRCMTPWPAAAVFRGEPDYPGGADDYLEKLLTVLVPAVEDAVRGADGAAPEGRCLAGYSLAGLFSVYAAYRTDRFDRFASASGSLWYPGFVEFVEKSAFPGRNAAGPARLYFSVGDKEKKTKNRLMSTVEENSRRIADHVRASGVNCTFELNPGGHFTEPEKRLARGIAWLLEP